MKLGACVEWQAGGGEADFVWHLLLTIWEKGPMIWIEEEKRLFLIMKINISD